MTFREILGATASVLLLARRPDPLPYRLLPDRVDPLGRERERARMGQETTREPAPSARADGRAWPDVRYWLAALGIFSVGKFKIVRLSPGEKRAYLALRKDDLFDRDWYLEHYPDVAASRVDPLHHFLRHGLYEGRSPCRQICEDAPPPAGGSPRAGTTHARYVAIVSSLHRGDAPSAGAAAHALENGYLRHMSNAAVQLGLERFSRFPLFRSKDYIALNEPLRAAIGLIPHQHALMYGFAEGRPVFDRYTVANELGLRSRRDLTLARAASVERRTPGLAVTVLYNSAGNSFLKEIAECLLYDLRSDGHDAILADDRDDPGALRDHNIIVAPHEFFVLGQGARWNTNEVIARSVMLNTEQPQTIWFERAVPFNMLSRGMLDFSAQVASIYGDCMPAIQCDPGGAPLVDVLPDAMDPFFRVLPRGAQQLGHDRSPFEERSLDVSFFGGMSRHRERFFARTAAFFADYKTLIYCRRDTRPLPQAGRTDLLAAARHAAFHSKIVLNIHRDEFGFFEWHRIVRLGIETGALVVSEPCLPHPDFKPGKHYLEESGRHIQNLVEWLLRTPDGRARADAIRTEALALVQRKRARKQAGRRIARFLADQGSPA